MDVLGLLSPGYVVSKETTSAGTPHGFANPGWIVVAIVVAAVKDVAAWF